MSSAHPSHRPHRSASLAQPAPLWRIEQVGAVTAVGTSAWQSAASWVGLQKRFRRQLHSHAGSQPLTLAACPEIGQNHSGAARLACLLGAALADLLASADTAAAALASVPRVALVLPDRIGRAECGALWSAALAELARWRGSAPARQLASAQVLLVQGCSTAGFDALRALSEANTPSRPVLLVAVDSLLDADLLRQACTEQTLLTDSNRDGFIPGEAAACLWLQPVPHTAGHDNRHLVLHAPAVATNPSAHRQTEQEPQAQALTEALRTAMAHAQWQDEHVGYCISDLDGSRWRAQVHATARARVAPALDPIAWEPCSVTGQVGAATGPLHWALAAQRLWHDPQGPNSILSWALSPATQAAAVALERTIRAERLRGGAGPNTGDSDPPAVRTFSVRFLNKS